MSQVRYRVLQPNEHVPSESHTSLGDDEYLAPSETGLDALEVQGVIEVLDWEHRDENDHFHGPPEPVVDDDGDISLLYPTDDSAEIDRIKLGTYVCQRCGVEQTVPIRQGDLEPPHECEGCERKGPFEHKGLGDYPDLAPSTFADPEWDLPSGANDERYGELWDDVRQWIYDHWVADEPHLYDGLTAFAISTWLRPNLNFVPQLMVMGKHETGKTQLLTRLAQVAYRGVVPVSFTPAAMFRTINKYDITLFLSEYHDLNPDLRDEVNAVIKGSQKRGENVMRTEKGPGGGYEPVTFDIFTHVALGTQFDPPDDIISRCIKIQTKPADRDVPVWFDEARATGLRNRLLYARYRLLESETDECGECTEWTEAEQSALAWLNDRDVSGRLREKLLSLVAVATLWDRRDDIEPFVDAMVADAEEAAAESDDALVVQAIVDLALEETESKQVIGTEDRWDGLAIPLSDVRDRFNSMTGRDVNSTYIGQVRKRLGLGKARRSDGVVIRDEELKQKLIDLCHENNLDFERSEVHQPIRELDDDEKYRSACSECGELQTLTHRHAVEGYHMCPDCAQELEAIHGE